MLRRRLGRRQRLSDRVAAEEKEHTVSPALTIIIEFVVVVCT